MGTVRRSLTREADPATNDAALSLGAQAAVEVARLLGRLQAKTLVEHCSQSLVPFGDRFAEPEVAFGFHCEAPERLVQRVDAEAALGCIEGSPWRAGFEPTAANLFKQVDE